MISLLFSILVLTLLSSANCQIGSTWTLDWQNSNDLPSHSCLPQNFTIVVDNSSIPINITYLYDQVNLQGCPNTSNLSTGATANIYIDSFGQQLSYNASLNFIQFITPNISSVFLYSINGSFIPIKDVYYPLFGSWHNPQQTNVSDQSVCCIPDQVFITETTAQIPGEIQLTMYYTAPNCSNTTTQVLNVWNSEVTTVNFGDSGNTSTIDLTFLPSGVNELNSSMKVTFNYTNDTCSYSYEKINITALIKGTWVLDWQSVDQYYPKLYQVYQVNNTYLGSSYTLVDEARQAYVSQTPQGLYYDSVLAAAFSYDNNTNTLLSIDSPEPTLYSPNGSLLNATDFVKNWSYPQTTADTSTCCIPSSIQITQTPSLTPILSAVYYYPNGYEENEGCKDFATDIIDGEYQSSLSIQTPSIVALLWTDSIGNNITWADPSNTSQIVVSVPGQCSLTMTDYNPQPNPLSASWLSSQVTVLMTVLFILVNYI